MMKKEIFLFVIIGTLAFFSFYFFRSPAKILIHDFESCTAAGSPVIESYPRQCQDGDKNYVEDIGNELEKTDLIRITSPRPGETIVSPVEISGEARGYWFFEGSFPVELFDVDGNKLSAGIATASSEWMTENFVPFSATISFPVSEITKGTLVLKKDNPSGLPENDDMLLVPIQFSGQKIGSKECITTGCSGQICAQEEVITTCEYRPEYSCYQKGVCESQSDGECGWTQTPDLLECLASPENNN